MGDVEVDQKPDTSITQFQVGQQLCLMYWEKFRNRFQFNNDRFLDQKINPIA